MPKYSVYAIYTASKKIGTYEADNEDEALEMSENDDDSLMLCHHCSDEVELNTDAYKYKAVKIDE